MADANAQQINDVFRNVLQTHVAKLDRVVAAESMAADFDWRDGVRIDERWHWVYRLLGMHGSNTEVDENAAALMRTAKIPEEDIFAVALLLQQLRRQKIVPTASVARRRGRGPDRCNIGAAQQVYYRALSQASAISARRQREGCSQDGVRAQAFILRDAEKAADQTATVTGNTHSAGDPIKKQLASPPSELAAAKPCTFEAHPVWIIGNEPIKRNKDSKIWGKSAQKQASQTYRMFVMLLLEQNVYSIESLQQKHFSDYKKLLSELAKSYGKSENDQTRTLARD